MRHGSLSGGTESLHQEQAQLAATEDLKVRHTATRMAKNWVEARTDRLAAAAAHPLAELLECPEDASQFLTNASRCIEFDAGETVFRQGEGCTGLYVVVAGDFVRKAERFQMRVTLGSARAGDLLELAAALGDGIHTYTLTAISPGSLLILPMNALQHAFEDYPPLRMRLLEELAREVSRAYITCCMTRVTPARRHASGPATA